MHARVIYLLLVYQLAFASKVWTFEIEYEREKGKQDGDATK